MAEGAPLLREYTSKAYRGFESLPLRHYPSKFQICSPATHIWVIDQSRSSGQLFHPSPLSHYDRRRHGIEFHRRINRLWNRCLPNRKLASTPRDLSVGLRCRTLSVTPSRYGRSAPFGRNQRRDCAVFHRRSPSREGPKSRQDKAFLNKV